jgi:hypothetical protein
MEDPAAARMDASLRSAHCPTPPPPTNLLDPRLELDSAQTKNPESAPDEYKFIAQRAHDHDFFLVGGDCIDGRVS